MRAAFFHTHAVPAYGSVLWCFACMSTWVSCSLQLCVGCLLQNTGRAQVRHREELLISCSHAREVPPPPQIQVLCQSAN